MIARDAVTGRRLDQKKYYRHSLYIGGLTEITLRDQLQKRPERVIELAVRGMLPKNTLGRQMLKKLKVYAGHARHVDDDAAVVLGLHHRVGGLRAQQRADQRAKIRKPGGKQRVFWGILQAGYRLADKRRQAKKAACKQQTAFLIYFGAINAT